MRTDAVARFGGVPVILMDSVSEVRDEDAGTVVVTGSHGGRSAGEIASRVALRAAFFNDAGVGKDDAGLAGLRMLDDQGIVGGAVSHESARIGEALDTWTSGVITHVNETARAAGVEPGVGVQDAVEALLTPDR
jgi:hypothetical protein